MLKEQTNSNNCLTKNYVGIDIGKKMLEIVRINTKSGKLERNQIKTNASGISELTKWLKLNDVIALEAGNQAFRIAKTLLLEKFDVIVLNPGDIKTIYASLKKTDKEDSLKLARLIQRNPREELPEVSVPSDDIEDTRRLISEQEYWVKKETSLKNRLHSLFVQAGLTEITKKHLDCHKNALITVEELPLRYKKEAERLLIEFKQIEINLEVVKNEITIKLQENISYTTMAMSLPGIGPITALTLYAYLGSCDRFSNSSQVSYYAGLVPRVDCSGETIKYGRIIKRGCHQLRRLLIQSAWAAIRTNAGTIFNNFYTQTAIRRGKGKAIVATARKMVEIFYVMMKNGELYKGIESVDIEKKLKSYGIIKKNDKRS